MARSKGIIMANIYNLKSDDVLFVECCNGTYYVQLITDTGEYRFCDTFRSAESAQSAITAWYAVGSVCLDVFERADYWLSA